MPVGGERRDGFTLIELLIVIVILGILAAVVVFSVRGATPGGQEGACKASSKTYQTAIESWYAKSPTTRTDTNSNGHPSGPDIETDGLIRAYDSSDIEILEPGDPGHNGSTTSTVIAVVGSPCDGYVPQS